LHFAMGEEVGPVNGIQLLRGDHRGRLMIHVNHSALLQGRIVSRSHVIYSDDHGATWQVGGCEDEKTNESTLVELADGSLLQNMRSYHGRNHRAIARSRDGGQSRSPASLDPTLIEPVCQASIWRGTWPGAGSRSRILFSNPASTRRENLTVRLSYDEGATWPVGRTIHPGPAANSCLAVLQDGSVACLYECGENRPYEKILVARFSLGWLEENRKKE
jgi:sialidase-1